MARITTYPIDSTPTLVDKVIGTNVDNADITMNYTIGDIIALAPGGKSSVQSLNTLTGSLTLVGAGGTTVTQEAASGTITITSTGGGGSPASPVNSIQVNNNGSFGGFDWFTTNNVDTVLLGGVDNGINGHLNIYSGQGAKQSPGQLHFYDRDNLQYNGFTSAQSVENSYTLSLPNNTPSDNQVLTVKAGQSGNVKEMIWGSGGGIVSVTGGAPISVTSGFAPEITITQATTIDDGFVTTGDWNKFNNKQSALVSGTNIKTINGKPILGSGDLEIAGGVSSVTASGGVSGLTMNSTGGANPDIQLGGAITLNAKQITNALGYTPYNATNPQNFLDSVTTTGTSGPATISGTTINIPQYTGGGGGGTPGGNLNNVQFNNPTGTFDGNNAFSYVQVLNDHSQLTLGDADGLGKGTIPGELILHTKTVGDLITHGQIQFENKDVGTYVTLKGSSESKTGSNYSISLPATPPPTSSSQVLAIQSIDGTTLQTEWASPSSGSLPYTSYEATFTDDGATGIVVKELNNTTGLTFLWVGDTSGTITINASAPILNSLCFVNGYGGTKENKLEAFWGGIRSSTVTIDKLDRAFTNQSGPLEGNFELRIYPV